MDLVVVARPEQRLHDVASLETMDWNDLSPQDLNVFLEAKMAGMEGAEVPEPPTPDEDNSTLRAVATDGHRLALGSLTTANPVEEKNSVIVPRKAIIELGRLLNDTDDEVKLAFSNQQIKVELPDIHFTSKLIDGQFPNYERVLPLGGDKEVLADRDELKQALSRAAILSNDKHRSVRINLDTDQLKATVTNQEQESAEEEISVDYKGTPLEIAFNNAYLLDLLNAMPDDKVKITFTDETSSALVTPADPQFERQYVVMPMRL